jgi:mannose PTS system EIID component
MQSEAGSATAVERRTVPRLVLVEVFLRSLLIQVGFNTRVMQGLGYGYALYPALRWLYPEREARTDAVRRHLRLFNTHPYFAAAILGGVVRIEERVAAGQATPADVAAFRDALASPLAAIGDAFFWDAVRPACALLAALTAPVLRLWAIGVFLLLYNAVHLSVRIWLFVVGYRDAEQLVTPLGRARFPAGTALIRKVAAVLAGAVAAQMSVVAGRHMTGTSRVSFLLAGSATLVTVLLAPRTNTFVLAYGALALALLGGLLF